MYCTVNLSNINKQNFTKYLDNFLQILYLPARGPRGLTFIIIFLIQLRIRSQVHADDLLAWMPFGHYPRELRLQSVWRVAAAVCSAARDTLCRCAGEESQA